MVQIPAKTLTLEEFLKLPETKPASEYIKGEVIQKVMPQGKHSILQRELTFAFMVQFRVERKAQAFPELRCTYSSRSHPTDVYGGRSTVPDIAVFCAERIPRESSGDVANAFNLHPDWTIEILSPNQRQSKVIRNLLHCLDYGTEMVWLVDPEEFCIFVYRADNPVQVFEGEMVLPVPEFAQGLQLKVSEIFAWLKE